ncbi:MAG: type II toxin-antitoxin system VapB family antitoxin [Terracidiphilus sp.]
MGLSIKNPKSEELIRELAALRGVSLVTAVTQATREALERDMSSMRESRMEWLDRITKETAAIMNDGRTSKEIMDELYDDETGLPK